MRLYGLAYACRLYADLSGVDSSITEFRRVTSPALDLDNPAHRKALLVWLNSWGCRQFARKYHPTASKALLQWGRRYLGRIPPQDAMLAQLSDAALDAAGEAYGDLKDRRASLHVRKSSSYPVTFGSTGAAKALYALRPHALPPWDDPIRKHFGYDGFKESYRQFLASVQKEVRSLVDEAAQFGIKATHIPTAVGRSESSLPKLVDEYYWITITRRFTLPAKDELGHWARWAAGLIR